MRLTYVNSPRAARQLSCQRSPSSRSGFYQWPPAMPWGVGQLSRELTRSLVAVRFTRFSAISTARAYLSSRSDRNAYLDRSQPPRICCLNFAERKVTKSRPRAAAVALISLLLGISGMTAKAAQELFR